MPPLLEAVDITKQFPGTIAPHHSLNIKIRICIDDLLVNHIVISCHWHAPKHNFDKYLKLW